MVPTELMKPMKQVSLVETGFLPKSGKQTRKAVFLSEIEMGGALVSLGGADRAALTQEGQWKKPCMMFPCCNSFAGLYAFEDVMPDGSTILRFRHLLEQKRSGRSHLRRSGRCACRKGSHHEVWHGDCCTLIAAPTSSTKNQDKKRDPDMTQTKMGTQQDFGMNAHIGVDAESGLIHTVECTTVKVDDITMMEACLYGEEAIALGDGGYHKANRTIEHFVKVRYCGLKKNTGQILTQFALLTCGLHRDDCCPSWARCAREAGNAGTPPISCGQRPKIACFVSALWQPA